MQIITVPHQTLRSQAKPVKGVDKKLIKFIENLKTTLANARNPRGAGLAAPQVNKLWRIFTTQLHLDHQPPLRYFINPIITRHSRKLLLGETASSKEVREEGCLSIPKLYGPVPRWQWIELEYWQVVNGTLVKHEEKFSNFFARVIQHETDHLNGVLFTDYSLQYDLPVYREDKQGQWREIDKSELEKI